MPSGLMVYVMSMPELVFWYGWNDWQPEIQEMLGPWGKVFQSCGSITDPARVYYKKQGREVVVLLAGGDKHAQTSDIKTALRLARNL